MDSLNMSTYLQTGYANQAAKLSADATSKSVNGITKDSSREEIESAVKDFETYMMEQVIKELKDTFTSEDEEDDNTMGMYKDLFMDQAINKIATQLVDQIGGDVTDDFVDQIMRNYGISGTTGAPAEKAEQDADTVSEDIAQVNGSTVTSVQA